MPGKTKAGTRSPKPIARGRWGGRILKPAKKPSVGQMQIRRAVREQRKEKGKDASAISAE